MLPTSPSQTPAVQTAEQVSVQSATPAPDGQIWIGGNRGISIIRKSGISALEAIKDSPSGWINAIEVDGEGRVWVVHSNGVSYYENGEWKKPPFQIPDFLSIKKIAFDTAGRIWIAHDQLVYFVFKSERRIFPVSHLDLGADASIQDLAVDPKGSVWAATSKGISRFDGTKWTPIKDPSGPSSLSINALAFDRRGRVWAGHFSGASVLEQGKWTNYGTGGPKVHMRVPDLFHVVDVAVGPTGLVWALTSSKKLCVFDGTSWKTFDRKNSGLIGGAGKTILSDDGGHIWVGTDHELAVYDGNRWLTYTRETAGLASNGVTAIAVLKDGPADPPVPKESLPGRLTGRIVSNGIPVSGAQVYICWDISWPLFSGSTPCLGKMYMVTTNITGNFVLAGLPIGVYTIAVRRISAVQSKWYAGKSLGKAPRSVNVLSGKNLDLGDIELMN